MTEKENLLHYLRHEPCERVPEFVRIAGSNELVETIEVPVCERPMSGSGYDVFGVHWTDAEGASHYTHGQRPIYDDIENWKTQVRIPNIERFDWETFRKDAELVDRENKVLSIVLYSGIFERATVLTSFEDCLVNLISDPENFADLVGAIADYKIALIGKVCDLAHPDIIVYHDDWGTNRSPFMNPELWRRVIKPHTKRIYDAIHAHDVIVCQHSCGMVAPLVPDMAEIGADAWDGQAECNDLDELEKIVGDRLVILRKPPLPPNRAVRRLESKYGAYPEKPVHLYLSCDMA